MLVIVATHIGDFDTVVPEWHASTLGWLGGALAFTLLGIVLSAVRWQRVLVAMDLPAKLSTLLNAYLAGQFVSNFLPSTIGGDALRVTRLSAANGEAPGTFASVVLDRMSGWLILPLLCLGGLAINPTLIHLGRASSAAVTISLVTLGALAGVLLVTASPKLGGRLAGHAGWLRFVGAVHLGLDRIRRRPAAAAGVLATGFGYQLAVIAAAVLGARALGIQIGPTALLAFFPAVAILQVLPFTVGGLGVREGALALFLAPLGVPTSQAVALGLLVYGMHLLASLLGAPAFAAGNRAARPAS
jgi:glycosyltransferase 2 family protein